MLAGFRRQFLVIPTIILILLVGTLGYTKPEGKDLSARYIPNQLIIKFKEGKTDSKSLQMNYLQEMNAQLIHQFSSNGAMLIEMPLSLTQSKPVNLRALVKRLRTRPEVEYAEPNWILHSVGNASHKTSLRSSEADFISGPNDPLFDEQYALSNRGSQRSDIFVQQAWTKTTGSRDVLVAVIDSGIDYTHNDIAQNYWYNPGETGLDSRGRDKTTNGIDDDSNGFVDDWRGWDFTNDTNNPIDETGHGTHCAGVIGGVGNNGLGITGVNWSVSLLGLKFLDNKGNGSLANAVRAVEYATSMGVHIMSNSWGGDEQSETMAAAIRKANEAGILFVVAAGNDSNNIDTSLDYPAAYGIDNIISVAAVDRDGQLAGFSNFGFKNVHIAAPGIEILSTIPGNKYEKLDGTSMAAPYVAGAAALIKSRFPQLNAREIKSRLLGGATTSDALAGNVTSGLLNVYNSLEEDFIAPNTPSEILIQKTNAATLDLKWTTSVDQGRDGFAFNYEIRRASQRIYSEADWNLATPTSFRIFESDRNKIQAQVEIPEFNSEGFLAIRAIDRAGNRSAISNNVAFTTRISAVVYRNNGQSLEGLTIKGKWGLENLQGVGKVLSDSPGDIYGYGESASITLPSMEISTKDVAISFQTKFDLEVGYDFGFLEISTDEGNIWKKVKTYSGSISWQKFTYSLAEFIGDEDRSLMIRFRLQSDPTTSLDGWYLSDIMVVK
jgi:subtilisin family serine protease